MQAVPKDGWISEETTANGFNDFYDEYMQAYTNKNPGPYDAKAYFYAWIQHPEYSLPGIIDEYTKDEMNIKKIAKETYNIDVTDGQFLWRRWKIRQLKSQGSSKSGIALNGDQLFKQEYPLTVMEAFQSGAGSVFDQEKVDKIVTPDTLTRIDGIKLWSNEGQEQELERWNRLYEKGIKFWELPEENKDYVIGVDPSDGQGSDNGVVDVWLKDEERQVAQFYGKVLPDELAEIAADLGYMYNEAFVGVENNMIATILFLSKIYSNYYFSVQVDQRTQKRTKKIGWSTNSRTRDLMIDDFIIHFDDDSMTIRSKITQGEMKTFIKKIDENGK
jgi:hypothetical protein